MNVTKETIERHIGQKAVWENDHYIASSIEIKISLNSKQVYVRHVLFMLENKLQTFPEETVLRKTCEQKNCIAPLHQKLFPKRKRKNRCDQVDFSCIDDLTRNHAIERINRNTETINECLISKYRLMNTGYTQCEFQSRTFTTHRLVYQLHHRKNVNLQILHSCGNSKCCNILHLREGTAIDNAKDKILHNTLYNRNSVMTPDIVQQIWNSRGLMSRKDISHKYNVSLRNIDNIFAGGAWNQITGLPRKPYKYKPPTIQCHEDFVKAKSYIESRVNKSNGDHWLWQGKLSLNGYGKTKYKIESHRLAYMVYTNSNRLQRSQIVRHKCKEKSCVNPEHLELGDAKANAADRLRDGTQTMGETHPLARISNQVAKCIKDSKGKGTVKERSEQFGVTKNIVTHIDLGLTWKHIQ